MSTDQIICLVDNAAGPGYRAEHGISFYLETGCLKMLFDTGQSGDVLLHNARAAGIDFGWLGLIVLSHGHNDHTGGLGKALTASGMLKLSAHEAAFHRKFVTRDGEQKEIGIPFKEKDLWQQCDIVLRSEPFHICGGLWTTGQIPRITPFETPLPRFTEESNGRIQTDPFLDDQSLVIDTGEGLMLICGCCHSGPVNTMEHVKKTFGRYPSVLVGGLHMESADEHRTKETVSFIKKANCKKAILGHCTGQKFIDALAASGVEVVPLKAGMRIS